MRSGRLHIFSAVLAMGLLLGGIAHSKTIENADKSGVVPVSAEIAADDKESDDILNIEPPEQDQLLQGEEPGWHGTSPKKRYYVKSNGIRALGYTKIGKYYYYFERKTSYCAVKKWRYVKLNGKKYKLYFGKNGRRLMDVTGILPKSARYMLEVNLSENVVMVYAKDGRRGYVIPARAMICSGGMKGHGTITGLYHTLRKAGRWHVLRYQSYGQYATRIRGPYLFHSVTYDRYGDHYSLQAAEYKKLGKSASHGCIRLQVGDAKWIYDNSSRCSAKLFYGKKKKLPVTVPKAEKIGRTKDGRYYDRTDTRK